MMSSMFFRKKLLKAVRPAGMCLKKRVCTAVQFTLHYYAMMIALLCKFIMQTGLWGGGLDYSSDCRRCKWQRRSLPLPSRRCIPLPRQ